MTTQTLLNKYPFSKHFYVTFALACANEVRHLLKDPRSIKALDMTALWLDGKVSDQEMKAVADDAYAAYATTSTSAAFASSSSAHSAAASASAYATASAYAYASHAASSSPLTKDDCYLLLIKTIKDYYSPFELEMLGINNKKDTLC